MVNFRGKMLPLHPHRSWHDYIRNYMGFTFGFGPRALRKFPELIPLLCAVMFSCSMGIGSLIWAAQTKTDVRFHKSKGPPHEDVGPRQCTKLYCHNPDLYRPIPELEAIKNDLRIHEDEKKCCPK